ncbi:MAG: hypothetical protein ACOH2Q_20070 [Rhodococcus sp. (in: high G+C Gram-positive bacteria)]
MNGEPYGRKGQYLSSGPEDDRVTAWRYGYEVDGDTNGPQHCGTESEARDASRSARQVAAERRAGVVELGLTNIVRPWIQEVTTVTTFTYSEQRDAWEHRS